MFAVFESKFANSAVAILSCSTPSSAVYRFLVVRPDAELGLASYISEQTQTSTTSSSIKAIEVDAELSTDLSAAQMHRSAFTCCHIHHCGPDCLTTGG